MLARLGSLLGIFVAAVLYFVAVYHLTNLYVARQRSSSASSSWRAASTRRCSGSARCWSAASCRWCSLFALRTRAALAGAAACVIAGGLAQVYVIIIGGQAYPQQIFPGKEVSSSFFDGVVAAYAPSLPEVALGVGGVALAAALVVLGLKLLPFLPREPARQAAPAEA